MLATTAPQRALVHSAHMLCVWHPACWPRQPGSGPACSRSAHSLMQHGGAPPRRTEPGMKPARGRWLLLPCHQTAIPSLHVILLITAPHNAYAMLPGWLHSSVHMPGMGGKRIAGSRRRGGHFLPSPCTICNKNEHTDLIQSVCNVENGWGGPAHRARQKGFACAGRQRK